VLYDTHFSKQFWPVVLVMLLGTWGMTVIGTMFSALTVNLRMREMMLPTLVYPLLIPALMAAMTLTSDLMSGTPLGKDNLIWLRVLAGFDFIYTVLAVVFIDIVLVG
jgi:heme exporter protein B